jgi:hypothetical protein
MGSVFLVYGGFSRARNPHQTSWTAAEEKERVGIVQRELSSHLLRIDKHSFLAFLVGAEFFSTRFMQLFCVDRGGEVWKERLVFGAMARC